MENRELEKYIYEDLGLVNGRDRHHLDSGIIIREEKTLRRWFTREEIETIAEADRVIEVETIIQQVMYTASFFS